jgi:hypothetical protein
VIPITTGANGTISESFLKYLSHIPGKREIKELLKTAILGAAHILGKNTVTTVGVLASLRYT